MDGKENVTVTMFGALQRFRTERGLSPDLEVLLPSEGRTALDIAADLGLPLDSIGAIYCNHRPAGPHRLIRPGDRIAFVPKSIPGPHRGLQGFPLFDRDGALPEGEAWR